MGRERLIQSGASLVLIVAIIVAGSLLPGLIRQSEAAELRYTDVSVDGAPPIVAIGTAIGALRGITVTALWIKVTMMKERGLFYEIMADTELITKLQPRFAEVWAFHGHNMAYNISVVTSTREERWQWVNQGINLVRKDGLRYNPNDLVLHKELAFWFAHKIEGSADDAHLYYKRELAREWHHLLGEPPMDHQERIEWIRMIADAPATIEEAEARTPGVQELVNTLRESFDPRTTEYRFELDRDFLMRYGEWLAVKYSPYARILGLHKTFLQEYPVYGVLERIGNDPEKADQWATLLSYVRRKVLLEEYNMDPALMLEYMEKWPLDFRHGQAHSLYWSRRARDFAEHRIIESEEDIYKVLNNDSLTIQAMQALSRSGVIGFDPFSPDLPARLPDHRWVNVIGDYFLELYDKHYEVRGAGSDRFIAMHQNYMSSVIRELYRAGELDAAQYYLDELNARYGEGATMGNANPKYAMPLDVFVREETFGEYETQPHVAINDVYMALRRGFLEGLLFNRPEVMRDALKFADDVVNYFRSNKSWDFVNKFGEGRMKDLMSNLSESVPAVFRQIMIDTSLPLVDRLQIYNRAPEGIRRRVYDLIREPLEAQFSGNPLAQTMTIDQVLPEPPGMEEYRAQLAAARKAQEEAASRDQRAEMESR